MLTYDSLLALATKRFNAERKFVLEQAQLDEYTKSGLESELRDGWRGKVAYEEHQIFFQIYEDAKNECGLESDESAFKRSIDKKLKQFKAEPIAPIKTWDYFLARLKDAFSLPNRFVAGIGLPIAIGSIIASLILGSFATPAGFLLGLLAFISSCVILLVFPCNILSEHEIKLCYAKERQSFCKRILSEVKDDTPLTHSSFDLVGLENQAEQDKKDVSQGPKASSTLVEPPKQVALFPSITEPEMLPENYSQGYGI